MRQTKQRVNCYHCGEACLDQVIHHDEHDFCCHGCQTVYSLLKDTGLSNYYNIQTAPGKTKTSQSNSHDFLELSDVIDKMVDFREGNQNRVTFYLPSIHCAACIWLLEKLHKLNAGVQHSEVNFLRKELTVRFDSSKISLKELVILLEDLGYEPDLQRKASKEKEESQNKDLLLKLGIAGFAFGNIMLFSFPEYLSIDDASIHSFKGLFNYLNLLLAIPVLIYSDRDYLISAWKSLRIKYLTIDVPIALGIITLFARSAYEVIAGVGMGYFDSFAGLVFFLLIGKWYQTRTYSAMAFDRDFKSYFPMAVTRIADGKEEVCLLEKIKPGHRLRILNNQIIPADAILIEGNASIDYSFVSGESDVIQKKLGEQLFAGGRQTNGTITIDVVKDVSQGYLTSLWNQRTEDEPESKTRSIIDRTSQWFSVGILTIAFATLVFWLAVDSSEALNAFTAVLIIACPCALALAMPFASGNVARILGKLGFFVRNSKTLETIASVNTIIFDKTGTLSDGKSANIGFHGAVLTAMEQQMVKTITSNSTHPLSVVLKNGLQGNLLSIEQFEEIEGQGISAQIQAHKIKVGSAKFCGTQPTSNLGSEVHVKIDDQYKGYYRISAPIRSGVPELIAEMAKTAELHLLSGDNESDADRMVQLFGSKERLNFNQSPLDKLNYINRLENSGRRCLMFGDGLNDAGALKMASVGIAVADDVFSFSPACDVIFESKRLGDFAAILNYIKRSISIVRVSIVISLVYNLVGLSFAVQAELTPIVAAILMPLSSVTVVAFVSFLTSISAPKLKEHSR